MTGEQEAAIDRCRAILFEHFPNALIIATVPVEGGCGKVSMDWRISGDYYAALGMCHAFIGQNNAADIAFQVAKSMKDDE